MIVAQERQNACNDATYTYKNVLNARLQGIEGQATYDTRSWLVGLSGSSIRGDNLATNQPLESVYPDKVALSGGIRFLDEKLTLGGRVSFVASQTRLPTTAAATAATLHILSSIFHSSMRWTRGGGCSSVQRILVTSNIAATAIQTTAPVL